MYRSTNGPEEKRLLYRIFLIPNTNRLCAYREFGATDLCAYYAVSICLPYTAIDFEFNMCV